MPPTKSKNIAGNTDSCTNKKNKFAQAEKSQVSKPEVVICDACPILCRIRKNQTGACERYGNVDGLLTRLDPMLVMRKVIKKSGNDHNPIYTVSVNVKNCDTVSGNGPNLKNAEQDAALKLLGILKIDI